MRAVLQRVDMAEVTVGSQLIDSIGKGILVFLGIERGDDEKDADYLLEKMINLRIFEDRDGKMNLSLTDMGGEMMVVSQFTILAACRKGRRPSFTNAAEPGKAKPLYDYFLEKARVKTKRVAGGEFQSMMSVELTNNGPVTMLLDSRRNL